MRLVYERRGMFMPSKQKTDSKESAIYRIIR